MKINKIVYLIVAGLVLRVLAAAFLYHTDTKEFYQNIIQAESGIVNTYREKIQMGSSLPYPPLVYSVFGAYHKTFPWVFSSHFNTWLNDIKTLHTENHPSIFRDLLAMKLPMLLADLLIAWLIFKMAIKERRETALSLWLLNPVTIYAIYATGQFDVIPTLFLTLGVFCWMKNKKWLTYLLLGLAGGLKLFPLLLLPMLFLIDNRKIWQKALGVISGVAVFGLSFWPVRWAIDIIKNISSSTHTESMFKAAISLGNGAELSLSLLIVAGLFLYLFLSKNKLSIEKIIVVLFLLILGVSRFHPQWIIWLAPFLVLLVANGDVDGRIGAWLSVTYFGTIILLPDKFTNFGLLKAINNAFDLLSPLRDYLIVGDKIYGLMLAAFLAGAVAIFIYFINSKGVEFDFGKTNLINKARGIFMIEIGLILVIFLIAHIPLSFAGRYIDNENMSENKTLILDKKTVISQEFIVYHNNFNTIQIRVKNVNLKSKSVLSWKLLSVEKTIIYSGNINENIIGDDFDLTIKFPRIVDSANKKYTLLLSDSSAIEGEELVVPYDNRVMAQMNINGVEAGKLAYRTFYNPGGFIDNLKYSVTNILKRL